MSAAPTKISHINNKNVRRMKESSQRKSLQVIAATHLPGAIINTKVDIWMSNIQSPPPAGGGSANSNAVPRESAKIEVCAPNKEIFVKVLQEMHRQGGLDEYNNWFLQQERRRINSTDDDSELTCSSNIRFFSTENDFDAHCQSIKQKRKRELSGNGPDEGVNEASLPL